MCQRVAQAGKVARTRTAQGDARGDAFDIDAGFDVVVDSAEITTEFVYRI
jgi:hypothetical protein